MTMSAKAIREFAERHGIPFLPSDHAEFKSGPQVRLCRLAIRQPSNPKTMKSPKGYGRRQ
jgi:hypothetical protein